MATNIPWNKGKKGTASQKSIDCLLKMSKERIGKKRPPFSKEWKEKISESNNGKKWTKVMRENFIKARTGKKMKRGWHHSKSAKELMSIAHTGEKNGNWKGGISKIDKLCRCMIDYRQWRSKVFERDSWTCQTCGKRGCYVTAHHIKSFSLIIKENNIKKTIDARNCDELWNIENGVTLCEYCHKLTDNYKGKNKKKYE